MTFGNPFFATILSTPKMVPNTSQNHPKASQRVPFGHHFRLLWNSRWKCENNCFVQTKPLFSWLEGVPKHFLCSTLRAMCSNVLFGTTFSRLFVDLGSKRGARGGPTKDPRTDFSPLFQLGSLGGSLGRPGSPNDTQGHQNDTKMSPKRHQNDTKIV